jgi:hypothetical protein
MNDENLLSVSCSMKNEPASSQVQCRTSERGKKEDVAGLELETKERQESGKEGIGSRKRATTSNRGGRRRGRQRWRGRADLPVPSWAPVLSDESVEKGEWAAPTMGQRDPGQPTPGTYGYEARTVGDMLGGWWNSDQVKLEAQLLLVDTCFGN